MASLEALFGPDASTSTRRGTLTGRQVFADPRSSCPSRALAKQSSSSIRHLTIFKGPPTHFQELALCLGHPQRDQPQLFQSPRLYSVQQAQSV